MQILYYKNDNLLELTGLKDEVSGDFVNDATVTATLKHRAGGVVGGQSFPITLAYVTGSDGNYRGVLDAGLAVRIGDLLRAEITISAPGNIDGNFNTDIKVVRRQ